MRVHKESEQLHKQAALLGSVHNMRVGGVRLREGKKGIIKRMCITLSFSAAPPSPPAHTLL